MTDIRRHLPVVFAALRAHVPTNTDAAAHAAARERMLAALREALPASYLVVSGRLVDERGASSAPVDVAILDATIPAAEPALGEGMHPVRRALAVVRFTALADADQLDGLLADVASGKTLAPARASAPQSPRGIPKARLPLGIIALGAFDGAGEDALEQARAMARGIRALPVAQQPDHLFALREGLQFVQPALMGEPSQPYTIGFTREPALTKPRTCYVCKAKFTREHLFYGSLCQPCGDLNLHKRTTTVDLAGRRALVTGGRVRIGYATALRLLRAGAHVTVTTRFPRDAAQRFAAEGDFAVWGARLAIYGVDLRDLHAVERFAGHLRATAPHLDILINNAAQTVRHPPASYAALVAGEAQPLAILPPAQAALLAEAAAGDFMPALTAPAAVIPLPDAAEPPAAPASWDLRITDEIDLGEMVEAQVINATAPLLLINRLRLLLRLSPRPDRYIINVTSVEGAFGAKLGTHPHTNMAKAALNMLTHTAAGDLAREGICMNAVDPGWVSPQRPPEGYLARGAALPTMPLDEVDAAARLCDPIFTAIAMGAPTCGQCYKDYTVVPW